MWLWWEEDGDAVAEGGSGEEEDRAGRGREKTNWKTQAEGGEQMMGGAAESHLCDI